MKWNFGLLILFGLLAVPMGLTSLIEWIFLMVLLAVVWGGFILFRIIEEVWKERHTHE
jgi:hypothetical protein